MESTSCLLGLKPSYYTIIVQYTIFNVRPGNNRLPRYGTLTRENTHVPRIYFPRTSGLARGKHPHSVHLYMYLARSPHLRRPQGFGNLPISRPGLGKLPTRQSMSSLWSPECLLPNSQLGRGSLTVMRPRLHYPDSDKYGMRPAETDPQITLYTTYINSTTFPCGGSPSFWNNTMITSDIQ